MSRREPEPKKRKEPEGLSTRTGGAYIPPAKLRMMQKSIEDKSSAEYQRLAWEQLKKSINGLINKVNTSNITTIVRELIKQNLVRGRGLLCRSIMQAQSASQTFTNVYAALVSIINSKFPNIGELLLKRLIIQFRRSYKRNDKPNCLSAAKFIAHLVNQQVAHEVLALELLTLLLEHPTEDSVEVAVAFLKEVGSRLEEVSPRGAHAIFERLRHVLHEGQLEKRVQYMIEVMFQVRKDKFKDFPTLPDELDLVEEEDQFTHLLTLDEVTEGQDILNVFKIDQDFIENEDKYATLRKEILDESEEEGSGDEGEDEDEDAEDEDEDGEGKETIIDKTETNLLALRRTIYLTIQSSLDFEECCHKVLKLNLKEGQEVELCHMILDCCAQQRTYEKFFGLLAQRFCNLPMGRKYQDPFQQIFKDTYDTVHRLDTNKLRNVAKFFAHLLYTDAISWSVMEHIRLTEDETTSSSRIFIKILMQELSEFMGLQKFNQRLQDPTLVQHFEGLFPRDHPKNTRFSINFFTSIGLGGLTDELREFLKKQPKPTAVIAPQRNESIEAGGSGSGSSSSSASDSSSDSSDSSSSSSGSDSSSSSGDSSSGSSSSSSSSSDSDSSSDDGKKKKRKKVSKSSKKKTAKNTRPIKKERHSKPSKPIKSETYSPHKMLEQAIKKEKDERAKASKKQSEGSKKKEKRNRSVSPSQRDDVGKRRSRRDEEVKQHQSEIPVSTRRAVSRERDTRRSISRERDTRRAVSRERDTRRSISRERDTRRAVSREHDTRRSISRERDTRRNDDRTRSSRENRKRSPVARRSEVDERVSRGARDTERRRRDVGERSRSDERKRQEGESSRVETRQALGIQWSMRKRSRSGDRQDINADRPSRRVSPDEEVHSTRREAAGYWDDYFEYEYQHEPDSRRKRDYSRSKTPTEEPPKKKKKSKRSAEREPPKKKKSKRSAEREAVDSDDERRIRKRRVSSSSERERDGGYRRDRESRKDLYEKERRRKRTRSMQGGSYEKYEGETSSTKRQDQDDLRDEIRQSRRKEKQRI